MAREREGDTVGDLSTGFSAMTVHWKINEFFSLPQEVDYMIKSPSFDFFGKEWYLTMCPNGESFSQYIGFIGLYLNNSYADSKIPKIKFEMSILDEFGVELFSKNFVGDYVDFNDGFGWDMFIRKSRLVRQKADLGPNGIVIVSCRLSVLRFGIAELALTKIVHEGVSRVAKNFKEFFLNEEMSDITLSVRGREFKCHRAVLAAQSPVFGAMLRQDMRERTTGLVEIQDCEPEAFQQFLTYLYSGSVDEFTVENTRALYLIADKYDVPELKAWCVHILTSCLRVENFCDILDLSLLYEEPILIKAAFVFFTRNAKTILATTSWQNFMKMNPIAANEFYLKNLEVYNLKM